MSPEPAVFICHCTAIWIIMHQYQLLVVSTSCQQIRHSLGANQCLEVLK